MNKRQKIIVSITGIFIVLLALVGLTYAYFLTQIRGNEETKSISVTTANLILEYSDGHGSVSLDNIVAGESGFAKTTKTFAVINRGNETIENYNVYLENVINQFEIKEDLRYKLTCRQVKTEDYEHYINELKSEDFSDVVEEVGSCNGKSRTTFPSVMSVIGTNTIDPGYTQYYELEVQYLFQNYDQSVDMNKQVSAKVNIYDGRTKFLSTEIINNTTLNKENASTTGTLYTLPNELPTKIAEEINGENEKILSYTLDDLGTSYYYRGNVNDNYVNFAGMCWRIVRIEGDGSVKLILEDKNTTCDNAGYTGNWSIGTGNYGYIYTSSEDKYKMRYLHPVDNADKSMVKAFYDFQNTFTTNELRKLKAGNWCLGDKAYTRSETAPYVYSPLNGLDYSLEVMFYDSYVRIMKDNIKGYLPTFKCNGRVLNNFESVIYNEEEIITEAPMYVSGITADEIVYAGVRIGEDVKNNYLINNFKKDDYHFWTLSPAYLFSSSIDRAYYLNSTGRVNSIFVYDEKNSVSFRPIVSLNSLVNITTKTDVTDLPGTINNPYVIN